MSDFKTVSNKTRRPLLRRVVALSAALAASAGIGLAGTSSAYAATPTTTVAVNAPQATQDVWHYRGSYFWGWHCTRKGNEGLDKGWWRAYKCVGSWIEDYKLYVRYW